MDINHHKEMSLFLPWLYFEACIDNKVQSIHHNVDYTLCGVRGIQAIYVQYWSKINVSHPPSPPLPPMSAFPLNHIERPQCVNLGTMFDLGSSFTTMP